MSSYRLFRSFLREQSCEEIFDRAFYSYNGSTILDEALWEIGDAEYIFAHAFDWDATPEGRDFWLNIDKQWCQCYLFKQTGQITLESTKARK